MCVGSFMFLLSISHSPFLIFSGPRMVVLMVRVYGRAQNENAEWEMCEGVTLTFSYFRSNSLK